MSNIDKVIMKDVSWIQRISREVNVDDSQAISSIQKIIDSDIYDGVFSLHFVASKGSSYEVFGYKKYTNYVDCLVLHYFSWGAMHRLIKTKTDGWMYKKIISQDNNLT